MGSITTLPGAPSPFAPALDDLPSTAKTLPSQSLPDLLRVSEPPEETLDDSQEVQVPVENLQILASPASLGRRLLALTIDAAVVGTGAVLFLFLAAAITKAKSPPGNLGVLDAWLFRLSAWHGLVVVALFLLAALALAYTTFGAFLFRGRTLGRWLTGLHLVDKKGEALTPVHAVTRATFALVSMGLFFSGFWLALFDRRGQTLHDKLASTFVVRLQA
jgi:uncharacterized RDD family membrane protein YckC